MRCRRALTTGERFREGIPWTSGTIYTAAQKREFEQKVEEQEHQFAEYLDRLRMDLSRPMVWLDVQIKGQYVGRITIVSPHSTSPVEHTAGPTLSHNHPLEPVVRNQVLFNKEAPRAAENYRQLITGASAAPRT
jgi:hypothetical protein